MISVRFLAKVFSLVKKRNLDIYDQTLTILLTRTKTILSNFY